MLDYRIVYSEVYEILSYMDKMTVMKIPIELLDLFKEQRDLNYVSKINSKDLFNPNNVNKKTIDIIAWLDLKYWANESEKRFLIERYTQNENNKNEKYIIFQQNSKQFFDEENKMIVSNQNIFTKIKLFIKRVLK